jgi:regulator of RNase E activity RraA
MTIHEHPLAPLVGADLIDAYRDVATSIISDSLDRMAGPHGPLPFHHSGRMIGTALTVDTRHGDNLAIHAALKIARPGDVLVIAGGGDLSQALIGEIIVLHGRVIGVAGFLVDGAIRDVGAIRAGDMPVYACGVTHRGPYKNGPGVLNQPVSIGGAVVNPGDLVVGDEDGVVMLSPDTAREILPSIRAKEDHERQKIAGYLKEISART